MVEEGPGDVLKGGERAGTGSERRGGVGRGGGEESLKAVGDWFVRGDGAGPVGGSKGVELRVWSKLGLRSTDFLGVEIEAGDAC